MLRQWWMSLSAESIPVSRAQFTREFVVSTGVRVALILLTVGAAGLDWARSSNHHAIFIGIVGSLCLIINECIWMRKVDLRGRLRDLYPNAGLPNRLSTSVVHLVPMFSFVVCLFAIANEKKEVDKLPWPLRRLGLMVTVAITVTTLMPVVLLSTPVLSARVDSAARITTYLFGAPTVRYLTLVASDVSLASRFRREMRSQQPKDVADTLVKKRPFNTRAGLLLGIALVLNESSRIEKLNLTRDERIQNNLSSAESADRIWMSRTDLPKFAESMNPIAFLSGPSTVEVVALFSVVSYFDGEVDELYKKIVVEVTERFKKTFVLHLEDSKRIDVVLSHVQRLPEHEAASISVDAE